MAVFRSKFWLERKHEEREEEVNEKGNKEG
jgi:hypothetical protein